MEKILQSELQHIVPYRVKLESIRKALNSSIEWLEQQEQQEQNEAKLNNMYPAMKSCMEQIQNINKVIGKK